MNTTSREERCAKADVGDLSCVPRVRDLLRAFYPPIPNKPGKPSLGSRELANPPLSSPLLIWNTQYVPLLLTDRHHRGFETITAHGWCLPPVIDKFSETMISDTVYGLN
jgi:hypothetical protein